MRDRTPVIALSGGIGGGKLALELDGLLPPQELLLVANTGDDFAHLGFHVCPGIDTLNYTLGGVRALILCPSNPFLSIDPILAVPGMRRLLQDAGAPIVAVSPIVGERALKGPTAKIKDEMGLATDVLAVAGHQRGLIDGLVIDHEDAGLRPSLQEACLQVAVTDTVMRSLGDRMRLARDVLEFANAIASSPGRPVPWV